MLNTKQTALDSHIESNLSNGSVSQSLMRDIRNNLEYFVNHNLDAEYAHIMLEIDYGINAESAKEVLESHSLRPDTWIFLRDHILDERVDQALDELMVLLPHNYFSEIYEY